MENIIPALVGFLGALIVASIGLFGAIIVAFTTTRFQKKQIEQLKKNFETDREDKYKFAALDKKLETHQKAFDMSLEISSLATKYERSHKNVLIGLNSNATKELIDMQNWWRKNCVYLEKNVRDEFIRTINIAFNYWAVFDVELLYQKDSEDYNRAKEEKTSQWHVMYGLPNKIIQGIGGSIISSENIEKLIKKEE